MTRRKQAERQKKHLLKNLNMFISPVRLCVRNLPPNIDDSKLRTVFSKNLPKTAKMSECKVMRDMGSGSADKAASKEYAFVTLERHEDAMMALRNINNNPTVFTNDRRPIVEFSIENRKALLARQKRLDKSREKNPNITEHQKKLFHMEQCKKLSTKADKESTKVVVDKQEYSGMTADPKQKGLPTHRGAKVRTDRPTKISRKDLRKKEEDRKNPKLKKLKRKLAVEGVKENVGDSGPPDAKKTKKEKRKIKKVSATVQKEQASEKKFASLVSQYKSTLVSNTEVRKKWFD